LQSKELRISVIIPTLQEQDYIGTTLSQLCKLKPPVEVVVVDGGSQDRTIEVARRYTDKVYRVNKHGIAAGRNYGAQKAKGDILLFMDADVEFPATFPKKVAQTFKDPIIVGATCNIMPAGTEIGSTSFFLFYNLLIRIISKFKPHSRGEFLAVRKTAFKKAKGFDETMPCLEDHDLANRLSHFGKFIFISDLTVHESLRRFKKLGFRKVVATWITDYISLVLRGRPLSPEWKPVR
jgi:glycosyltransferase involved in cell wall biosynthesis